MIMYLLLHQLMHMFCKSSLILTTKICNPKLIHDWPEYLAPSFSLIAPIIKVNQAALFVIYSSIISCKSPHRHIQNIIHMLQTVTCTVKPAPHCNIQLLLSTETFVVCIFISYGSNCGISSTSVTLLQP